MRNLYLFQKGTSELEPGCGSMTWAALDLHDMVFAIFMIGWYVFLM